MLNYISRRNYSGFLFSLYKGLFNHFKLCYPEPSTISVILGLLY